MLSKIFFFVLLFFSSLSGLYSQISINKTDLPAAGEKYLTGMGTITSSLDFFTTGPNISWDFSNIETAGYNSDSFGSIRDVPVQYRLMFFGANLTRVGDDFFMTDNMPSPIEEVYNFYTLNSVEFSQLGIGLEIQDQKIPLRYSGKDRLLKLPLQYGMKDSSTVSFELPFDQFYYLRNQKRKVKVDGWGEIITPEGTFDVLRVKTELIYRDSIKIFGFPANLPEQKEYNYTWYAKEMGTPVFKILTRGALGNESPYSVTFFADTTTVEDTNQATVPPQKLIFSHTLKYRDINSMPELVIHTPKFLALDYYLLDVKGNILLTGTKNLVQGENIFPVNISGKKPGLYFLICRTGEGVFYEKILIPR